MHHELKMWHGHFQHVVDGDMKGDIRHVRDRTFSPGDTATFLEIDNDGEYTGRDISCQISHVSEHGVLKDHRCLSLSRVGLLVIL